MEHIYETAVYDGRTKEWRILNLNTGTVYAGTDDTEYKALKSIKNGERRAGKVVQRIPRARLLYNFMKNKNKKLIPKVTSLYDLENKAKADPQYRKLAIAGACNLGGACETLEAAMKWLRINADETTEKGVIGEVNFCRDLV